MEFSRGEATCPRRVISQQKFGTRASLIIGAFINKRRANYSHRRDCSFSVVINAEFIFSLQKNREARGGVLF